MKIGLGTYACAWSIGVPGMMPSVPMTVFDFINQAAKVGAEGIQLADNVSLAKFPKAELLKIRTTANNLNLFIEVGMRGLTINQVSEYLGICQLLEAKLLRVVIDQENYYPAVDKIVELINALIPSLQEAGVRLAVENHDRLSAVDFRRIIESTNPEWVGICLDSVNSLGCGEGFYQVTEQLLPYTINLHLKDYKIERKSHNMGFEVSGTVAGRGMLPIPWLFAQVDLYGRCDTAILELWPSPEAEISQTVEKELSWVQESMEYLKSMPLVSSGRG